MRGVTANGEVIRAERIARGLTQEKLATLAGLDVKTVRKAEHGKRLDATTLAHIAKALRVELSRLIA